MTDLSTTLVGLTDRRITSAGDRRTVLIERSYDATPGQLWSA